MTADTDRELKQNVHRAVMALECCFFCGVVTSDWHNCCMPDGFLVGPVCTPCVIKDIQGDYALRIVLPEKPKSELQRWLEFRAKEKAEDE